MAKSKMDSKKKHPFVITCRKCGSNSCVAYAYEYHDLSIWCKSCGTRVDCGAYHTDEYDYSGCSELKGGGDNA